MPGGHAEHAVWPEMEVVPAGHAWHADCPAVGLKEPAAQGRHAPIEEELALAEYVPEGQGVQAMRPATDA